MFLFFLSQDQAKSSAGVLSDVPTDLNQLGRGVARCNPYILGDCDRVCLLNVSGNGRS